MKQLLAVAQAAGTIFRLEGGGAQLTFASVVHDGKKPRVTRNLAFSSVLGHLFFPVGLFTDKNETKI